MTENAWRRELRPEETVGLLRQALASREDDDKLRRAMALGLVPTVVELCPQCCTVLHMPKDAVEAVCGNCTAMIRKTAYGWETHG